MIWFFLTMACSRHQHWQCLGEVSDESACPSETEALSTFRALAGHDWCDEIPIEATADFAHLGGGLDSAGDGTVPESVDCCYQVTTRERPGCPRSSPTDTAAR
jgi:hypothetical protein